MAVRMFGWCRFKLSQRASKDLTASHRKRDIIVPSSSSRVLFNTDAELAPQRDVLRRKRVAHRR